MSRRYRLRLILVLAILLHVFSFSSAQQLVILDKSNGEPIENVAVFTPEMRKSVISDRTGHIDIGDFAVSDTLVFQHPTYEEIRKKKEDLLQMGLKVYLVRKIIFINESVVSATRWEQNRREIPNQIEKINKLEITFYHPQTTADLLGETDQVFIQKSQLGGGSPMIRGFAANSLLIMVDGIRMNNAIFRSGNLQNVILVDPNTIQSAEVIFGPGTVIYGSDALGGVMDFHTLHPSLSTSEKANVKVNVFSRYESADRGKTAHFDIVAGKKKMSWVTGITWSDYGDLRMGSHGHPEYLRTKYVVPTPTGDTVVSNPNPGLQIPTAYRQLNLLQKFRYRASDDLDFVFSFYYTTSGNIPRYDRLIQEKEGNPKYAEWYYGPQKWFMPQFTIENSRKTKLYDQFRVRLAYQDYTESRHDRKFGNDALRNRTEKVYVGTIAADFNKVLIPDEKFLYYGIEANYNKVVSKANTENIFSGATAPAATRYPDGYNHYYAAATYLLYKQNLSPSLTLNIGGRYNLTGLHSGISDTSFYHFPFSTIDIDNGAFNGSAGITYHPDDLWQMNINLSSGFRAPNLDDAGKVFDSEPGKVIVPNRDLKPEYVYNIDGGIIRENKQHYSVEINSFFSYLDNAMVRRPFTFNGADSIVYDQVLSQVQALTNTGHAIIYGAGFQANVFLTPSVRVKTSATFTHGQDSDGYPLRHAAPFFGGAHLIYEKKPLRTDLFVRFNGSVPYSRLALSERSKSYMYAVDENGNPYSPGWATLNVMVRYQLPFHLSLETGVENIFDVRYRPYSSGIVAPGRNFMVSLRYSPD